MGNRKRSIQIIVRVSEHERALIEEKMALLGTRNLSAYLCKMAIDGETIRLEVPERSNGTKASMNKHDN